MNLNDELLANLKTVLETATKLKKVSMTPEQSMARDCVVTDTMNAFAHAHNLIVSLEKGTDPFWSVPYPKQIKLPKRRDNTEGVSIAKLQLKLKRLAEQLEKTEEQSAQSVLCSSKHFLID